MCFPGPPGANLYCTFPQNVCTMSAGGGGVARLTSTYTNAATTVHGNDGCIPNTPISGATVNARTYRVTPEPMEASAPHRLPLFQNRPRRIGAMAALTIPPSAKRMIHWTSVGLSLIHI